MNEKHVECFQYGSHKPDNEKILDTDKAIILNKGIDDRSDGIESNHHPYEDMLLFKNLFNAKPRFTLSGFRYNQRSITIIIQKTNGMKSSKTYI